MQAQASLGVTRANQFPTVGGVGSIQNEQSTPLFTGSPWIDTLGLQMNYIVDFWGQYRRATEAARANLLATEYARNVVQITLISSVATTYFQLRQFDAQLEISKQTVIADNDILRLNTINFKGGEYAITDVYQAQLLVQQAEAEVISLNQLIPQTENALSILARQKSRAHHTWPQPCRSAAFARCPSGPSFCASGAPPRCARRRKKHWSQPTQM